jgi:hypothetical protein
MSVLETIAPWSNGVLVHDVQHALHEQAYDRVEHDQVSQRVQHNACCAGVKEA